MATPDYKVKKLGEPAPEHKKYGKCWIKSCKKDVVEPHLCPNECGAVMCSSECVEKHTKGGYLQHIFGGRKKSSNPTGDEKK